MFAAVLLLAVHIVPDELLMVIATVDDRNIFYVQRKNVLLLGYATGYRGEILNPPRKRVLKLEDMGSYNDQVSSSRNVARWSAFLNYHVEPSPEGASVYQLLSAVPSVFPASDGQP
eukprot:GGOE01045608.1.p1 GENE.GGOE01045608.1~~GGOE01045608.1.p1  ORF type:complete len:116 (-),score=17.40 GGOE01045608.1:8-355(-)